MVIGSSNSNFIYWLIVSAYISTREESCISVYLSFIRFRLLHSMIGTDQKEKFFTLLLPLKCYSIMSLVDFELN